MILFFVMNFMLTLLSLYTDFDTFISSSDYKAAHGRVVIYDSNKQRVLCHMFESCDDHCEFSVKINQIFTSRVYKKEPPVAQWKRAVKRRHLLPRHANVRF